MKKKVLLILLSVILVVSLGILAVGCSSKQKSGIGKGYDAVNDSAVDGVIIVGANGKYSLANSGGSYGGAYDSLQYISETNTYFFTNRNSFGFIDKSGKIIDNYSGFVITNAFNNVGGYAVCLIDNEQKILCADGEFLVSVIDKSAEIAVLMSYIDKTPRLILKGEKNSVVAEAYDYTLISAETGREFVLERGIEASIASVRNRISLSNYGHSFSYRDGYNTDVEDLSGRYETAEFEKLGAYYTSPVECEDGFILYNSISGNLSEATIYKKAGTSFEKNTMYWEYSNNNTDPSLVAFEGDKVIVTDNSTTYIVSTNENTTEASPLKISDGNTFAKVIYGTNYYIDKFYDGERVVKYITLLDRVTGRYEIYSNGEVAASDQYDNTGYFSKQYYAIKNGEATKFICIGGKYILNEDGITEVDGHISAVGKSFDAKSEYYYSKKSVYKYNFESNKLEKVYSPQIADNEELYCSEINNDVLAIVSSDNDENKLIYNVTKQNQLATGEDVSPLLKYNGGSVADIIITDKVIDSKENSIDFYSNNELVHTQQIDFAGEDGYQLDTYYIDSKENYLLTILFKDEVSQEYKVYMYSSINKGFVTIDGDMDWRGIDIIAKYAFTVSDITKIIYTKDGMLYNCNYSNGSYTSGLIDVNVEFGGSDSEFNILGLFDGIYSKNGLYGIMSISGDVLVAPQYTSLKYLAKNYYIAEKNGYYGIINNSNKVMRDFKYSDYSLNGEFILLKTAGNDPKIELADINLKSIASDAISVSVSTISGGVYVANGNEIRDIDSEYYMIEIDGKVYYKKIDIKTLLNA